MATDEGLDADGPQGLEVKKRGIDYEQLEKAIEAQRHEASKDGKLNEAVEVLLNHEKQMRLAADVPGTKAVVLAIVQICHEAGNWKALNENIILLSKRRAQLKQAVTAMVQEAIKYIDGAPDLDTQVDLIKTLSTVTAGKIYVEIERARLTKKLASIKEAQGKGKEAAELMQEVAVETFGAMAKTEKIAFILEQVRLCLDVEDYMRAQILAKKISTRVFAEATEEKRKKPREGDNAVQPAAPDVPTMPQLKLKYYELMIRYYVHQKDYLEICRCYQAIFDTPSIKEDKSQWIPVLKKICWYLVLAPHSSMQLSLLTATHADKRLLDLPKFRSLLSAFLVMEVINWPQLAAEYASDFAEEPSVWGGDSGKQATEDLRQRVIEHNILVISKYYTRLTLKRLSELLGLSPEDTEKHLSEMVVSKALTAKVDRPAGIVVFEVRQDSDELLNAWANNLSDLLKLVETSCHQIHREIMVHRPQPESTETTRPAFQH